MPVKIFFILLSAALFIRCPQQPVPGNTPQTATQTLEDSLYKAVIKFHDEVMPKMGKIQGYQKTVQAKIDSLTKLLAHQKNETGHELKHHYELLLLQLQAAENGMNNWMDSFEPDPKLPSQKDLEKYWQNEYAKTKKMRDNFKSALDSASSRLDK